MPSLFMTVMDALTPSLRGLIAEALDERPELVERGARSVAGGVVSGLMEATASPPGADSVLAAVRRMDVGLLFDASPLLDTNWTQGVETSPGLLGDRASSLARATAAQVGLRPESASALTRLIEPLVLAAIARSGVASDEAGLRSYLRSLQPEATRYAPANGAATPARSAAEALEAPSSSFDAPTPAKRAGLGRVLWVVLALIALSLVLLFTVGRG